ncbi:MAG: flagellar filament capping protein FliD [Firmicutes bacterium]|nr:flagellar filament capping protein FliD [Bacillota bacterium]
MANNLGISGIATGMDTQALINQIMQYSKKPLDRLKQQQQILIWQQEAYRSLNASLSQLRDLAFDLKLQSGYNVKTVTSSNNQVVTASASSSTINASFSLEVKSLAQAARNYSSAPVSIRSKVTGNDFTTGSITIDETRNSFQIRLGSKQETITLGADSYGTYNKDNLKDLAAKIQQQLIDAGFTGKDALYVKVTSSNELQFYAGQNPENAAVQTITLKQAGTNDMLADLGFADGANSKELVGSIISNPDNISITSTNNRFKIALGNGPVQEVILETGTYNLTDFAAEIEAKIQSLGGSYANIRVSVNGFDQLRITSLTEDSIRLESSTANNGLATMGFSSGTVSDYPKNTIDTGASLWNLRDKFINAGFFEGKSDTDTFGFTINGQSFSFSYKTTLESIIAEINGNAAAGVSVFYDEYNDRLYMTATQAGNYNESGPEIQITDTNGFLSGLFNISQEGEESGVDAEVVINGVPTKKKSNTFTMNGITFTLTGEGKATVSVNADTSAVCEKVENFVNKYNEILAALYEKTTEERPKSGGNYYLPLTDEQKEAMTEDQIEKWEEQAKKGLLRNDSILRGAINSLRMAVSQVLETTRTLTGVPLAGTINTNGANRFSVTLGGKTEEIVLDEGSYSTKEDYQILVQDIQRKLDLKFGAGRVKVALGSGNNITFTTQNESLTLNSSEQNNGLNAIGFSDGATVKATYNRLSQIGITTGHYTENGKLYLDKEILEKALAEDPDAVIRLLTNYEEAVIYPEDNSYDVARKKAAEESSKGIFYKLHEVISAEIAKFTNKAGVAGMISANTAIGRQLLNLEDRIQTYQDRLYQEEDRLWNIFNQMEVAISRMNMQLAYLQNMSMFGQQPR